MGQWADVRLDRDFLHESERQVRAMSYKPRMTWDRFRNSVLPLFPLLSTLACDGTEHLCGPDEVRVGVQCIKEYSARAVRLNSVG
ncbi:MAG TPA: hypothetical protein VIM73_19080, partial [Polyangiaceae bacterium]